MQTDEHINPNHESVPSESQGTPNIAPARAKSPISIPAAIITGAVIIAIALLVVFHPVTKTATTPVPKANQNDTPTEVDPSVLTVRSNDHVRGNLAQAEVILYEYSDSDCSFCGRFHPVLLQLMDEYKGKLAWVYRYFPLDIHPNAYTEALALQCVGELGGPAAFHSYLDTIMYVTLNPDPKSNQALVTYATDLGLDNELFKKCMANPATAAPIDAGIKEAQTIGARGTPFSILVNVKTGKQVVIPGAYPVDAVRADIENLLK